jgi:L-ascorbate metabolism protein UlaG (beta-lactamase superfamily)
MKSEEQRFRSYMPAAVRIQRLFWAGLRLEIGDVTLLVDAVSQGDAWGPEVEEAVRDTVVPVELGTRRCYAVVTHGHNDHFDRPLLTSLVPGRGWVVSQAGVQAVASTPGLPVRNVAMHEPFIVSRDGGEFVVWPVPAVDGLGDPQVSWMIDAAGTRILHCGDTMWHANWWDWARIYGPIDIVFLPINGVQFELGRYASLDGFAASLRPEEAAAAAFHLGAGLAIPMHYGIPDSEGYLQAEDAEARFLRKASELGVETRLVPPGEWLDDSAVVVR